MKKIVTGAAAIASLSLFGMPAHAASQDSGSFSVSLNVPVICNIEAMDFVLDRTQNVVRGVVNENCNSSRGFQVLASHRPLGSGELVEINYDGSAAPLEASGLSAIAFRSGARFGPVPVAIRSQGVETNLAVSLSVTAI
ncbi:hypothetical protein [Parasphingorhabdus flavimaris]|uniref:hypothetical protein n=1 Tax=Parasphingorhabdus flavimaris TaxID=266812 RepID=UPI00300101E1